MNKYNLLAHNNQNFVKVGDFVEQYKTKIGSIGTANGAYWAHLHHSVSTDLTPQQIKSYIKGWSQMEILKYYEKPTCDYEKMFGRKMDVGNAGYDWLQDIGNGFHPGLDINGTGGGNTDLGYEYTSPCTGKVISAEDWGSGWGNVVIIEENNKSVNNMKIIDLSHWNTVTDWDKLKDFFIIQKCTEGTSYLDATYKERKDKIQASYHFAGGGDAIKEADWFVSNFNEKMLVLDWEIEHKDPVGWCKNFIERVKEKTGIECWLYTNDARALKYAFPKWKKWIARYKDYTGDLDWDYQPKSEWDMWQYTSRGKVEGIDGNVDMNVSKVELINLENNMDEKFVDAVGYACGGKKYGKNLNLDEQKDATPRLIKVKDDKEKYEEEKQLLEVENTQLKNEIDFFRGEVAIEKRKIIAAEEKIKNQTETLIARDNKIAELKEVIKKLEESQGGKIIGKFSLNKWTFIIQEKTN